MFPSPHPRRSPRSSWQLQRFHVSLNLHIYTRQEPKCNSNKNVNYVVINCSVDCLDSFKLMSCFCVLRISRLFSDAKKILLYSQNGKSMDGFKELIDAVKHMQNSTSGGCVEKKNQPPNICLKHNVTFNFSCFVQASISCECLINV